MANITAVPELKVKDKALQGRILFLLNNWQLREKIAEIREEFGLPAGGLMEGSLAESEPNIPFESKMKGTIWANSSYWEWNNQTHLDEALKRACNSLRYIFTPALPKTWQAFFVWLVIFDDPHHYPSGKRIYGGNGHAWSRSFELYEIYADIDLNEYGHSQYVGMKFFGRPSKQELQDIIEKELWPRLESFPSTFEWNTNLIKLHARVADLRREKKSARQIASILDDEGFGSHEENRIYQMIRKAKEVGFL